MQAFSVPVVHFSGDPRLGKHLGGKFLFARLAFHVGNKAFGGNGASFDELF